LVIHVGGVSLSLVLSDQLSLLAQLERNNDEETDGQREVDLPHESVVAEASEKAIDRQQDPQGHKPSLPSLLVHQSRGHWHVLNGQWPALTQFLHDALTTHRPVPRNWPRRDLNDRAAPYPLLRGSWLTIPAAHGQRVGDTRSVPIALVELNGPE